MTESYEETFEYYWPVFIEWLKTERMKQVVRVEDLINSDTMIHDVSKIFACEFIPIIRKLEDKAKGKK